MSEWWSYSLSDFLLFSPRTYYRLFELHNAAVWPAHLAALAAGLAVILLLWRPTPARGRLAALVLAAAWLFVAWSYHLLRYATINWAAVYIAAAFALQALLLVLAAAAGDSAPGAGSERRRRIGLALVLFAVLLHPLVGPLLGRDWSQAEIFAIAPDPTVLATLGAVLTAARRRWVLLPLPLLWCALSGATLWTMKAPDAALMPAAGVLALAAAAWPERARRHARPAGDPPAR